MVVLGFRPKAVVVASSAVKVESTKPEQTKENFVSSKPSVAKAVTQPFTKSATKPVPSKVKKSKHVATVAIASSNWQKLKSLNTLKVTSEIDSNAIKNLLSPSAATSQTTKKAYVPDEEWFGVSSESLKSAEAIKAVGMLKTGVTAISLFPPPPPNVSKEKLAQVSKFVALDCEMVGVGPGGFSSALARVSLVNFHGQVLVDAYVKSLERVTDFRTAVSGIKPGHITPSHEDSDFNQFGQPLLSLRQAQDLVAPLISDKIVIGHSLKNDFKALMLSTGKKLCRDTSQYAPFRKLAEGKSPSLRLLAAHVLGVQVQDGVHDSVEDARIAMLLYRAVKKDWESHRFSSHQ